MPENFMSRICFLLISIFIHFKQTQVLIGYCTVLIIYTSCWHKPIKSNTTGATSEAGSANSSGALSSPLFFSGVHVV